MKPKERFASWRRRRSNKLLWKYADRPMSCHCWTNERGIPAKHASWCPAGKTFREFAGLPSDPPAPEEQNE